MFVNDTLKLVDKLHKNKKKENVWILLFGLLALSVKNIIIFLSASKSLYILDYKHFPLG